MGQSPRRWYQSRLGALLFAPGLIPRAFPSLAVVFLLGLGIAGCETPLQTSATEAQEPYVQLSESGAYKSTVDLIPVKVKLGVTGTSTLNRGKNGFSFQVAAGGLTPGRPVTLWVIGTGGEGRGAGGNAPRLRPGESDATHLGKPLAAFALHPAP